MGKKGGKNEEKKRGFQIEFLLLPLCQKQRQIATLVFIFTMQKPACSKLMRGLRIDKHRIQEAEEYETFAYYIPSFSYFSCGRTTLMCNI